MIMFTADDIIAAFDPGEQRDAKGEWTKGGGGSKTPASQQHSPGHAPIPEKSYPAKKLTAVLNKLNVTEMGLRITPEGDAVISAQPDYVHQQMQSNGWAHIDTQDNGATQVYEKGGDRAVFNFGPGASQDTRVRIGKTPGLYASFDDNPLIADAEKKRAALQAR